MFTQIKLSRQWQESPSRIIPEPQPFQEEYLGYNFLRNIWSTYFNGRENTSIQDKLDKINKVVSMVKSQIKILTIHQEKQRQSIQKNYKNNKNSQMNLQTSILQLQRLRQAYQRSQMRNQQLEYLLYLKEQKIRDLQRDNYKLKNRFLEIKKAKNSCEQKIIQLSKRLYEFQRNYTSFTFNLEEKEEQVNNTLSLYSAHSNEPYSIQRPKLTQRNRGTSIRRQFQDILRFDNKIQQQQKNFKEISQFEELGQLNLNLPNNFRYRERKSELLDRQNSIVQFNEKGLIRQIKNMKKKAQKMVQLQSQRHNNQYYRKTFDVCTQRPKLNQQVVQKQRRFRRIR